VPRPLNLYALRAKAAVAVENVRDGGFEDAHLGINVVALHAEGR